MRNRAPSKLICAVFVIVASSMSFAAADEPDGFTLEQLSSAMKRSGLGTQRLFAVQTFGTDDQGNLPAQVAVLSSSRSGWHISVFHRAVSGFQREWYSGNLPDEFDVSSRDDFSIEDAGDEPVILFSGCARHQCGGGRHGFLVYSVAAKQAFFSLLEKQNAQSGSRVTFSKNALEQRNERYRQVLQKAVDAVVHATTLE